MSEKPAMYNPIYEDPYKKEILQDPYRSILKQKREEEDGGHDDKYKLLLMGLFLVGAILEVLI